MTQRVNPATQSVTADARRVKPIAREYELITEAAAQLSLVRNCSRFCLPVCSGGGEKKTAGAQGVVSSSRGWGRQAGLYTGKEHLEQFRTTESSAWASVNNSYSLPHSSERDVITQGETQVAYDRYCSSEGDNIT